MQKQKTENGVTGGPGKKGGKFLKTGERFKLVERIPWSSSKGGYEMSS